MTGEPTRLAPHEVLADSAPLSSWSLVTPCSFYKSEADGRRRAGGLISTVTPDQQDETVLQTGLDFAPFLRSGWVNDDHRKGSTSPVGYPEKVLYVRKGEVCPDGLVAPADSHWMSAYMLDDAHSITAWEKAEAAARTGGARSYGWSLEGDIVQRAGANGRILARAVVKHVALTPNPVNREAGYASLSSLAKSLTAIEEAANLAKSVISDPPEASAPIAIAQTIPAVSSSTTGLLQRDTLTGIVKGIRPSWPDPVVQQFVNLIWRT